ncbi:MAG: HU family DNA-binding protein [Acidobacteria bacterium]|nr:MAG: HU family DNA-binding protein [Acidobacteriota bacterium]
MTRSDLIEAIAQETGTDRQQAKAFLEGFTRIVEREMKNEGEVPLAGLGKFKVTKRKARVGRNPMTGESIHIPAKTVAKFTVAKALKDAVKK